MSIWKYPEISKLIDEKYRLSLNEGNTPLIKLFLDRYELRELGVKDPDRTQKVYLKLETANPNKSFKDRSLAFQISHYYAKGVKRLLISSSGNAAVSAAGYISQTKEMKLAVFVSNKVNKAKLEKLNAYVSKNPNISIVFSDKAKSDAIKYSNESGYVNLRGSADEMAVTGFKTIGYELFDQSSEIDAIFIPTSSGTSTLGIYQAYKEKVENKAQMPKFNVCQTTKIHPIAKEFDIMFEPSETSLADAIVDRVAKRKSEIVELVKETNGSGWILSDEEIKYSLDFLQKKTKLPDLTSNGILSFAGLVKALKRKKMIYRAPVCIISGI